MSSHTTFVTKEIEVVQIQKSEIEELTGFVVYSSAILLAAFISVGLLIITMKNQSPIQNFIKSIPFGPPSGIVHKALVIVLALASIFSLLIGITTQAEAVKRAIRVNKILCSDEKE